MELFRNVWEINGLFHPFISNPGENPVRVLQNSSLLPVGDCNLHIDSLENRIPGEMEVGELKETQTYRWCRNKAEKMVRKKQLQNGMGLEEERWDGGMVVLDWAYFLISYGSPWLCTNTGLLLICKVPWKPI